MHIIYAVMLKYLLVPSPRLHFEQYKQRQEEDFLQVCPLGQTVDLHSKDTARFVS